MNPKRRQEVSIVGMEHRAVHDATAEVGGTSAARGELKIDAIDDAAGVEADRPVDPKIMPLAGHHHVVVAVETQLAWPARRVRGERGDRGPLCRLGFLAAEAAAHAAYLASDIRNGSPEPRPCSTVTFALSRSTSMTASVAARRAISRVVAMTAKIGWP